MTALIADYYRHLTVDLRRSDHTVRAYVATAERLTGFLTQHWGEAVDRGTLSRITAADLRAYLAQPRLPTASRPRLLVEKKYVLTRASAPLVQQSLGGLAAAERP